MLSLYRKSIVKILFGKTLTSFGLLTATTCTRSKRIKTIDNEKYIMVDSLLYPFVEYSFRLPGYASDALKWVQYGAGTVVPVAYVPE
jgi:hypothetical protein